MGRERGKHGSIPTTSTSLLGQLADAGNAEAWEQFATRYRHVVALFARSLGLNPDEADDVAQQTMLEVLREYRAGRYDRSRGRLRSWVFGIARHRAGDAFRSRAGRDAVLGDSAMGELADEAHATRTWDDAEERALFQEALAIVRRDPELDANTLRAFERFALDGVDAEEVARACGFSRSQVYVAKHRVIKRLRDEVERLRRAPDEAA